jgi:hypothetical protein
MTDSREFRTSAYFIVNHFKLADFDGSQRINILDLTFLINYLYRNGPPPIPLWMGDVNRDLIVDMQDVVKIVDYMFKGMPL